MKALRLFWVCIFIVLVGSCGKILQNFKNEGETLSQQNNKNLDVFHRTMETLAVGVYYEPGAEPYAGKFLNGDNVWDFLETNLKAIYQDKLPGLQYEIPKTLAQMSTLPAQNKTSWSAEELLALRDQVQFGRSSGTRGEFALFFLKGYFEGNQNIIGVHLGGTSVIGVFKEVIEGMTQGESQQVKNFTEQITVIHEMGHSLGLVNLGVPVQSPHHDEGHKGHCTNSKCVMYWANQGRGDLLDFVRDLIISGRSTVFDNQCIDDFQKF